MTHRNHFQRIMQGDATGWAPNYELGCWGQTIQRWLDEGMPAELENMNMWTGVPQFDIDQRAFASINIHMMPGFEMKLISETDEYETFRDNHGIVHQALKTGQVRGSRASMDRYIDHPVKDRASWADIKRRYDPGAAERYPPDWDALTALWEKRDYPVCLLNNATFGLYSGLRNWSGTENISLMFYDDPALVEEMIEFYAEFLITLIDRAVQQFEFDYFNFFEDCAGKGGPLFGPEMFRKFFMKPYKRIIERLRAAGIRSIWVDSDGDSEILIPLWMEAGVNCHWPLEQASGMDPIRLRKKFGKELVLCGGIDKREIAKGRAAIDRELHAKIPPMMESGGYIPHIDHSIPPDISYDDFCYYMDLKRRLTGHCD